MDAYFRGDSAWIFHGELDCFRNVEVKRIARGDFPRFRPGQNQYLSRYGDFASQRAAAGEEVDLFVSPQQLDETALLNFEGLQGDLTALQFKPCVAGILVDGNTEIGSFDGGQSLEVHEWSAENVFDHPVFGEICAQAICIEGGCNIRVGNRHAPENSDNSDAYGGEQGRPDPRRS